MEEISNTGIPVSVFYNRLSWHNLIKHVISPFIRREYCHGNLISSSIYLSAVQGDHITIVLIPSDTETQIEQRFSIAAEQFLFENPSHTDPIEYPLKGFFMDYPNNSVWCKLFAFNSMNHLTPENMDQHISEAIMKVFENGETDMESIYTFIIYMRLGIIKAAYPDLRQARIEVGKLAQYAEENIVNYSEEGKDLESIMQLGRHNTGVMTDIITDIWEEVDFDRELTWMKSWIEICKRCLGNKRFQDVFNSISIQICNQVGLKSSLVLLSSLKVIASALIPYNEKTNSNI